MKKNKDRSCPRKRKQHSKLILLQNYFMNFRLHIVHIFLNFYQVILFNIIILYFIY